MSHVATVGTKIKDLGCLKKACSRLGLEFREGQKNFKWFGKWVNDYHGSNAAYKHGLDPKDYGKCDHAIGIQDNHSSYEVGVVKQEDGTYGLVYDFYAGGGGLMAAVGEDCCKVLREYAREMTLKEASLSGFHVEEENTLGDGSIEIYLTT